MQIGMMNRGNVAEYMKLIEGMNGGKKVSNPLDQVSWLDPSKKNTPIDFVAPEPKWEKIATKTRAPKKTDAELEKEIIHLARKAFAENKHPRKEYVKIKLDFMSKASPDRKKIYSDNKKAMGGKMNAALAYFTPDNKPILAYNPSGHWWSFTTDGEHKRADLFNDIYNGEMRRLKNKYGQDKLGKVSLEQIERENPEIKSIVGKTNSFDMKI